MRTQATFLSLLACCSVANAQNLEPLINGVTSRDYFRLTFQDEFNGNTLDMSKWTHTFAGKRWDALVVPEAVSVGNGDMTIKTWSEPGPAGNRHYTGAISTYEKFTQAYGYYESRINFDGAPGLWSAFWVHSWNMTGSITGDLINRPDIVGAEIDIVEHRVVDNGGNNISIGGNQAVHWNGYGAAHESSTNMNWNHDIANGYHTFGLLWARDRYEFYYDGDKVWSFSNANAISSIPEFMILSTEVWGGVWGGSIPAGGYGTQANTAAQFKVDYVRAYEFNADSPYMPEPVSLTYFAAASAVCRRRR